MGRIIQLQGDPHHQTQRLLPWYVNDRLDADEVALVEAHLAECAECQGELRSDRTLGLQIASLPMDVELGWAALREKVNAAPRRRRASPLQFLRRPISIGWALAAQLAAAALILAVGLPDYLSSDELSANRPAYHALGSAPVEQIGNVVVLFRPDTSVHDMSAALEHADARLVDGPTASGAYVLRVAEENRAAALKRLRAARQIVLAEPIGAVSQP